MSNNDISPDPAPIPPSYPRGFAPEKYENGKLTRESMVAIINSGGSVMLNGQIINQLSQLPTSVDLAEDKDELRKAERDLESREDELKAERKKLETRQKKMDDSVPPEDEEETFGDEKIPLSQFKGKSVDDIIEENHAGIGRRKAERIVKLLEQKESE